MFHSTHIKNENIHDSIIITYVNQILTKSSEYNDLNRQLDLLQRLYDRTPENEVEERLKISKEISTLQESIQQFQRDVLQLAQVFQRIEVNTDRLRRAQEFFDTGKFDEARAVLATELENMRDEQTRLLRERERYESEILPKLKHNAEEFYVLALASQFDYTNPKRFEDTCRYFDLAVESDTGSIFLFPYAYFLATQKKPPKAEFSKKNNKASKSRTSYSKQFINTIPHQLSEEEAGRVVYNMAILHANQNEDEHALQKFEEALQFYRNFADADPITFLPELAGLIATRASFYFARGEVEKALADYEEAAEIYRNIGRTNRVLSAQLPNTLYSAALLHFVQQEYKKALQETEEALRYYRYIADNLSSDFRAEVAKTLHLAAILHSKLNDYEKAGEAFDEALRIHRTLAKDNPTEFLPSVANTLHHSGNVHCKQNQHGKALREFEEALEIRRDLYEQTSDGAFPLAETLVRLAILHQVSVPMRDKSIEYALEAIVLLSPQNEIESSKQELREQANQVLRSYALSEEAVQHLIRKKTRDKG